MSRMFVRFGTKEAVNGALKLLEEFDPKIERDDHGMVTVYAPDGDIVFQAIPRDKKNFILRYHDEVFDRGALLAERVK